MVLLDTCALIWLVSDPARLSSAAGAAIRDPSQIVCVSAISGFEIGLLVIKGKLHLGNTPDIWFRKSISGFSLRVIPVSWEIAVRSTQLPPIHNDPMDRIIIATAVMQDIPIISPDRHFPSYPDARIIW
jgi:PIN domain nuclease of toxin-antitoxin system